MADLEATRPPPTTLAQAQLINAGFRPARFGPVVRFFRRLLWPLIRPFHFHLLEEIEAVQPELRDLRAILADRSDAERFAALAAEMLGKHDQLARSVPHAEDVQAVVLMHTRLRAEMVAIANRHIWLEERLDRLVDSEHAAAARLAELEHQQKVLHQRAQLADDVLSCRKTEGLFLTLARDGVFLLKTGEVISEAVRRDGVWDAHVIGAAGCAAATVRARRGAPKALRAVDAGAHFGLITVALARLFDAVTSFEPNQFNVALLRANIMLNGLVGKVDIRPAALASATTQVSLACSEQQEIPLPLDAQGRFAPMTGVNLGAYSFVEHGTGLSEAHALAFDELALDDVAFLKVDVQGADGAVIMGAVDTIARCQPWIVFEWEDVLSARFNVAFDTVQTTLRQLGYAVRELHRHNQKQVDYVAVPAAEVFALPGAGDPA